MRFTPLILDALPCRLVRATPRDTADAMPLTRTLVAVHLPAFWNIFFTPCGHGGPLPNITPFLNLRTPASRATTTYSNICLGTGGSLPFYTVWDGPCNYLAPTQLRSRFAAFLDSRSPLPSCRLPIKHYPACNLYIPSVLDLHLYTRGLQTFSVALPFKPLISPQAHAGRRASSLLHSHGRFCYASRPLPCKSQAAPWHGAALDGQEDATRRVKQCWHSA